jgi:branched-chain amino acid aminotransferase
MPISKTKLQTPEFALKNGELIPWKDAVLHVGCEAVNRGLSVFEGIKGYWRADGTFGLLEMRKHYRRLVQSARLLHIPCPWSYEEFESGVVTLTRALITPENDLWIRATLFVVEGHWGEDTKADLLMTAYQSDKSAPSPLKLGISTWQRSPDNALSYRIKSAANYQVGRLARIEGRARQCDDMILLNQWGRVAEATGAAVLFVRDKVLITPSHTEGALESITIDIAEVIAESLAIKFVRRPVDRTELLVADEICICGTLAELVPVEKLDEFSLNPDGPILGKIRTHFEAIVRGPDEPESIQITTVAL